MQTAALLLQNLGFLLYGGPMVAFAILVAAAYWIPNVRPWDVVRVYRSWGAGFGLALGACILGGLARYYLDHGSFTWGWSTPDERLVLGTFLAFLAMWISNIKLEIWTLDPLRKLDQNGVVSDTAAWDAAHARLARHMARQAFLVVLVAVLASLSGIS